MLLPAHLVDYVILHELCHTKHMDHSEKFWALMQQVTNNQSKQLRAEMKKYNMPED
jgi:predicted metal-dependent hydrolase